MPQTDHSSQYFNANWLLNSPRSRLTLQGSSKAVTYSFKLVRSGPKGRRVEPLSIATRSAVCAGSAEPEDVILEKWAAREELVVGKEPIHIMAPGEDQAC